MHHRTHDGRAFRTLNVLDEFTRESLAIRVRRKLSSTDVIDVLTDLFILRGIPAYVRSDTGPEFVAEAVRRWITAGGARTAFIEPGSPWENGYIESFNARLRDELLNGEIFYTLNRDFPVAVPSMIVPLTKRSSSEGLPVQPVGWSAPGTESAPAGGQDREEHDVVMFRSHLSRYHQCVGRGSGHADNAPAGGPRRPLISARMPAKTCRGSATSAIWKMA